MWRPLRGGASVEGCRFAGCKFVFVSRRVGGGQAPDFLMVKGWLLLLSEMNNISGKSEII